MSQPWWDVVLQGDEASLTTTTECLYLLFCHNRPEIQPRKFIPPISGLLSDALSPVNSLPLLCVAVRVSAFVTSSGRVQFSSVCMQSCFWGTWCRLQLNRRRSTRAPPSCPLSVPVSSAGSTVSKWIRHLCRRWCDNHTTSLALWQRRVLPSSHSQVYCRLSVNIPDYKLHHGDCDLSALVGFEAHFNFVSQNPAITNLQTPLSSASADQKMSNTGLNVNVSLLTISQPAAYSVNIILVREWRGQL